MPVLDIPATIVSLSANTYGTIVGGSTALTTSDGDATYVDIDKPVGPFSGYQLRIAFPATNIPGTMDYVNLVTVAKGTASPNASFNAVDEFWLILGALDPDDYTESEEPLNPGVTVNVTQEQIESGTVDYTPGSGWALINDTHTMAFHTRFTYVALRVGYTVLVQPPQRVFPREDGLAGPGGRRNYPPPRSRQRSPRTFGGYL